MVRNKKIKVTGNFTSAEDLIKTFLKVTGPRQKAKEKGNSNFTNDAGYWENGLCDWGGEHKLDKDAEVLANFFNSIASITDDVSNIKLSANEQIFNTNKQQLISKLQDLIGKCRITKSTSIGNICCIWNNFFGSFLKKYLDKFSSKLQRHLNEVEKLTPKHQKELLDLEQEAREAESAYKENLQKADDPTLSKEQKAEFIILANKAAKKAEEIKRKVKNNPLTQLANFNFLDDLRILAGGNVPPNISPDRKFPKKDGNKGEDNGNNDNLNPLDDPKNFFNQYQTEIFIALALGAVLFLLYNQQEEEGEDIQEDKKFMRQMMLMKEMNRKDNQV